MTPFSFIHASDLHLGSPFRGVRDLQPEISALLQAATFEAFDALLSLCLERHPHFLLVVGDIFDTSNRSVRAQLTFRDGLARLAEAGIPAFVVFGNHDPWEAWSAKIRWPKGVHVFGPDSVETVHLPIDGNPAVSVSGISFRRQHESRRLSDLFAPEPGNFFKIAMLHGNCGGQPGHDPYAPCTVMDLKRADFDYWALGHVHEKKVLGVEPYIVYPGCIQGHHIREVEAHGCYHVKVSGPTEVALEFCPLDRVRWQLLPVTIDGHESLDGLDRALLSAMDELVRSSAGRPVICRLSLVGRGPLYQALHQQGVSEDILERLREVGLGKTPLLWIQKLEINCLPEIDLNDRMKAEDLLGMLLKTAEKMRCEKDSPRVMNALGKVYHQRRFKRYLKTSPDPDQLLREVQLLCVDLLGPDS